MFQWNLSTMTFDTQYFIDYDIDYNIIYYLDKIVINKNQTLLALNNSFNNRNYKIYVISMETGTVISKYG